MEEHEELHEQREREADDLERESERVGEHLEAARKANAALDNDELIAKPKDGDREDGEKDEDD